jgi:hypothetical protein
MRKVDDLSLNFYVPAKTPLLNSTETSILKTEFHKKKYLICTPEETCHVSATKTTWLMPFRERFALHCENNMEDTDSLYGQNADF